MASSIAGSILLSPCKASMPIASGGGPGGMGGGPIAISGGGPGGMGGGAIASGGGPGGGAIAISGGGGIGGGAIPPVCIGNAAPPRRNICLLKTSLFIIKSPP